jgi:hypothetical protein
MNASDVGDGNFCSHIVGSIMTKEVPCITSLYEKIRMNKNAFSLIVVSEVKDNSNWCLTPYKLIQGLESLQVVLVRELIIEYDGILIRIKVQ